MTSTSREKGFQPAKQEDGPRSKAAAPSTSTSSRQWSSSGFSRNPRIVRVSRSFGGKDRHSKVCTIRGLRDRRIRLSVPTAIQLYDLQDRLGLSQPSKVIDWLLDVTKDDIDHLPPLQIPQGLFGNQFHHQHHQQMMLQSNNSTTSTTNNDHGLDHHDHQSKYPSWDLEASSSLMRVGGTNKGKEVDQRDDDHHGNVAVAQHMINPYYMNWEPSPNLTLSSQFGSSSGNEFALSQMQDHHHNSHQDHQNNSLLYSNNNNAAASAAAVAASLSHSHHHHHLFFCPPVAAATVPSLFPTYAAAQQLHNNLVMPISSLAITSSSSQVLKPFSILNAQSNPDHDDHDDKEDT